MQIQRLQIRNLRSLRDVDLAPSPGLNLLVGDNGAGKTSVLEALHVMAYGRSFRARVRDGLIRSGAEAIEVFVEWQERGHGRPRRAGLRHAGQTWEGRLDGGKVSQLGDLCAALMVVSIEAGSHALVTGSSEPRRRFIDWGLFHVEPEFLQVWRRYARSLKQRNAALKAGAGSSQLTAWDHELADVGDWLTRHRVLYLQRLQEQIAVSAAELMPDLGTPQLDFLPGWRQDELALADALLNAHERDRSLGYTSLGPHRADWRLRYANLPNAEPLSRGQAKLAAICCQLAQARDCAAQRDEWPILAVDDLASELDRAHQARVAETLVATGAQLFVTGTARPSALETTAARMFHVEHGEIVHECENHGPDAESTAKML